MRRRREIDGQHVHDALEQLWSRLPAPPEDDLHALAAAASAEARYPDPAAHATRPRWTRPGRGWALVLAGAALLIGSALGFGLGSSLTPTGTASGNFVGFGFMPAQGWSVMQSGTLDHERTARAIAANVPLAPRDGLNSEPLGTLASLPPRGVVISVTFRPRGDAETDAAYPAREAPLSVRDASRVKSSSELRVSQYLVRAALGGYNVDARVYFGAATPSASALNRAQRQLDRLVVAADRVTIFARPTTLDSRDRRTTTLFGTIDSGKAGELVTVQAKDCGSTFFRVVDGATTTSGGAWTTQYTPGINTVLRAVWAETASNQVAIKQRVGVGLRQRSRSLFSVGVGAPPRGGMFGGQEKNFGGKRVLFQRRDQRVGRWVTVRRVRLDPSRPFNTEFRATVSRGSVVRALFPQSEARPCYVSGTSFTLRT